MILCWELFKVFIKIGAFTLGGGYVMVPLIESEVVKRKKWIPQDDFYDMLTLAQSAPGPIAVNAAVFVGYKIKGLNGALASVLGVVLPSFFIILIIAYFFEDIRDNEIIGRVFKSIRPAVVALIIVPVVNMLKNDGYRLKTLIIMLISTIAVWWFSVSPVLIIAIAGMVGLVLYILYFKKKI